MIFTDRIVNVNGNKSEINKPIIVYRGDYEIEIRFTIMNSGFNFVDDTNLIASENASYGQLAILTAYGGNVFSPIAQCDDSTVAFILTKEMLDQLEEVGLYSFQIRLYDQAKMARVTIPPVEFGIEVREPVASEDHDNSANNAIVGYSIAKVVNPGEDYVGDTFDKNDNYNKTKWKSGDRISENKLNKIEDAIDILNKNEKSDKATLEKKITNEINIAHSKLRNYVNTAFNATEIVDIVDSVAEMVDADKQYVHAGTKTWWIPRSTIVDSYVSPHVDNALNWDFTSVILNKRHNSLGEIVDAPGSAIINFDFWRSGSYTQIVFTPNGDTGYVALTIRVDNNEAITQNDIQHIVVRLDDAVVTGEIYLNQRYSQSAGGLTSDNGTGLFTMIFKFKGDVNAPHTIKVINSKVQFSTASGNTLYLLDNNKSNPRSVNGNSNISLMTEGVSDIYSDIANKLMNKDPVWVRMKGCSPFSTPNNKNEVKIGGWTSEGSHAGSYVPGSQIIMYEETKDGISSTPYKDAVFPYTDNRTAPVLAYKFGYYNRTVNDDSTNAKSSSIIVTAGGTYALSLIIDFSGSNEITISDLEHVYITFDSPIMIYDSLRVVDWSDTGLAYAPGNHGAIADLMVDVNNIESRIDKLEAGNNDNDDETEETPDLPDYWLQYLNTLDSKIIDLQRSNGMDTLQFLWCSDIHGVPGSAPNDTSYIGKIGRYMMDEYHIPFFIVSGDIMSQASHTNVNSIWYEYGKLNPMLAPINDNEFLAVKGNHDGAWGASTTYNGVNGSYYHSYIGDNALFNAFMRRQTLDSYRRVFGKDGMYFYVDYHGYRIYMLNTHTFGDNSTNDLGQANYNGFHHFVLGNEQLQWIADTLNTVKENQQVMFVAHAKLNLALDQDAFSAIINHYVNRGSGTVSKNIVGTHWGTDPQYSTIEVNCDFSNAKGSLIGWFNGHIHIDSIDVKSYTNIPLYSVTTAGGDLRDSYLKEGTLTRTSGTATETAMDLVTVTNGFIYFTRIGSGYDRVYNRTTKEVTIDYSSAYIPPVE